MDPVTSAMMPGGFGQEIVPTTIFKQYLCEHPSGNYASHRDCNATATTGRAANKPPIDVLIVPGSTGRRDVSEEIAFVAAMLPGFKHIISICTGATLLSRAWRALRPPCNYQQAELGIRYVAWREHHMGAYCSLGRGWQYFFTSSGVSAGKDAMYTFVSRVYGEDMAKFTSLSLECNRVVRWDDDPFVAVWDVPGAI